MAAITSKAVSARRASGSKVVAVLIFEGVAVFGLWIISLVNGSFPQGVMHYQDGNYPILHLAAESLMGALAITGGIGLLLDKVWGGPLAYLAFGALAYSSINSAGWPVQNNPSLLVPMAVTLVATVICVPYLLLRTRI